MVKGVDEEPLRPVYKIQPPPWVGRYVNTEYKGRANWWQELGYEDRALKDGRFRVMRYEVKEQDPEWTDPPVPIGESVPSVFGEDTKYYPRRDVKGDQVGNVWEFKDKIMKSSAQYKNIAEKYKLSPEHPGLSVSPSLSALYHLRPSQQGVGSIYQTTMYQYGPRFFDKPLNEGCFEKGCALAKYAIVYSVLYSAAEFQSEYSKTVKAFSWSPFALRCLRNYWFPGALSFGYGVSICTAATIRNKDDNKNPLWAAAATGIIAATIKDNIPLGITTAIVLAACGTIWQYSRIQNTGLAGPQYNPMYASPYHGGPQLYKLFDISKAELPKETY